MKVKYDVKAFSKGNRTWGILLKLPSKLSMDINGGLKKTDMKKFL